MRQPLAQLEALIGHRFAAQEHLELALTHRSVSGDQNNERLEFVGDSILNFVIGDALFVKFPEAKEGQLSRLRASLVKGKTLALIGRQFGLERYVNVGPGELKTGGASRDSTLADAVEAIIGAIYLDAGIERCTHVVLEWYAKRLDALSLNDTIKDNKTRLQEWLQQHKVPVPRYEIVNVSGDSHQQVFTVHCHLADMQTLHSTIPTINLMPTLFEGQGGSRRHAEQQAAGKALSAIQSCSNE